jgi:hypothetical protein
MNTRHFTVEGIFDCTFSPPSGTSTITISGIEVQLWQKRPMENVFLGKGLTDSDGKYHIEFSIESPDSNIDDGKLSDVFIKASYKGNSLDPSFDPDAVAYFELLTPQPSLLYKIAVNNLVKQLKTDGNWGKLDRFWIHATEEQQHATISLVNPSSTPISEVNSPTWTASQGYTGDGASSYLNTNFNPASGGAHFTTGSACLGIYSRTNTAVDGFDMGAYDGTDAYLASKFTDTYFYGAINCGTNAAYVAPDTLGLILVNRTSSSNTDLVQNGSVLTSSSATSTTMVNLDQYVLARNGSGYASYFSTRQLAISLIGGGNIDQSLFYTAVQDFATAIGFNV